MQVDLLKTIEDDEEVPNYSEDSDKEVEVSTWVLHSELSSGFLLPT